MKINLLLILVLNFHIHTYTLHQWNTYVSGIQISSAEFLNISGGHLKFVSNPNYDSVRAFELFIIFQVALCSKYSSSSLKTLSLQRVYVSVSLCVCLCPSISLLWGKQAATSERALWQWPCDKEPRPPNNSQ